MLCQLVLYSGLLSLGPLLLRDLVNVPDPLSPGGVGFAPDDASRDGARALIVGDHQYR